MEVEVKAFYAATCLFCSILSIGLAIAKPGNPAFVMPALLASYACFCFFDEDEPNDN